MKFLGASIFKSDGFHIFCYISVGFFFSMRRKSRRYAVSGEKKKPAQLKKEAEGGKKPQMHCRMRRNRCKLLFKVRKRVCRLLTGLM